MNWPKGFCDIGGKSFDWTYENKPEFVEHTLHEMRNATGLFKEWQMYCTERSSCEMQE